MNTLGEIQNRCYITLMANCSMNTVFFSCIFIAALATSSSFAQVPVIQIPKPFEFENYIKSSATPAQPQINPFYPANAQFKNPSTWITNEYYTPTGLSPQEQFNYANEQIRMHEAEKMRNQLNKLK